VFVALALVSPSAEGGEARLCTDPDAELQLILQTESVGQTRELFAGMVETPDPTQPADIVAPPGALDLYVAIVSQLPEAQGGVQGWVLALRVLGDMELIAADVDGTVGARVDDDPPGLMNGGFEKTSFYPPEIHGQGAASAVVLSFTEPITLDPVGTATVFHVRLAGEDGSTGGVSWFDFEGEGEGASLLPSRSSAAVNNKTRDFACLQEATVRFADDSRGCAAIPADAGGPFQTAWERTFAFPANTSGNSVDGTADGGYVVTGPQSSTSIYVVKTNGSGDAVWQRSYQGDGLDTGFAVRETSDLGIIVVGQRTSTTVLRDDLYLVKLDAGGDVLWERTYGEEDSDELGYAVVQAAGGGHVAAGRSGSFLDSTFDAFVVRTDADGSALWERRFGGEERDEGFAVVETWDGGSVVAGIRGVEGFLFKVDRAGDLAWEQTFAAGPPFRSTWLRSVVETPDGGVLAAGYGVSSTRLGRLDRGAFFLVRATPDGTPSWQRTFPTAGAIQLAFAVRASPDGGYVVGGTSQLLGPARIQLFKVDGAGDSIWEAGFAAASVSLQLGAMDLSIGADGAYAVAASTAQDRPFVTPYLARLAPSATGQVPSDLNQDGRLDLSDGVCLLSYLFLDVPLLLPCSDGAAGSPANLRLVDANGDRRVDISDAIVVFGFLFLGRLPPVGGTECIAVEGCPGVCPP
jgi:hypothetical protein